MGHTKASLVIIKETGKASFSGLMVSILLVNGKMGKKMEMVIGNLPMDKVILVIGLMDNHQERELRRKKMALNMKVNLKIF